MDNRKNEEDSRRARKEGNTSLKAKKVIIEFSLNRTGFQFKGPHCYPCLHGAVLACWFITQEVGGLNTPFCRINFYRFCRSFGIHLGKTRIIMI